MELVTLSALSALVAACLRKAGEKFSEQVVVETFEVRHELAERFLGLFKSDIVQLGLSDPADQQDVDRRLAAHPQLLEQAVTKLKADIDSFKVLLEALQATAKSMTINNNFANQTNNDKCVNVVGDNTRVVL